jgi:hypothetical protein
MVLVLAQLVARDCHGDMNELAHGLCASHESIIRLNGAIGIIPNIWDLVDDVENSLMAKGVFAWTIWVVIGENLAPCVAPIVVQFKFLQMCHDVKRREATLWIWKMYNAVQGRFMTCLQTWIEESLESFQKNNNNWQAWRKLIFTCRWYLRGIINIHNGDLEANQWAKFYWLCTHILCSSCN